MKLLEKYFNSSIKYQDSSSDNCEQFVFGSAENCLGINLAAVAVGHSEDASSQSMASERSHRLISTRNEEERSTSTYALRDSLDAFSLQRGA